MDSRELLYKHGIKEVAHQRLTLFEQDLLLEIKRKNLIIHHFPFLIGRTSYRTKSLPKSYVFSAIDRSLSEVERESLSSNWTLSSVSIDRNELTELLYNRFQDAECIWRSLEALDIKVADYGMSDMLNNLRQPVEMIVSRLMSEGVVEAGHMPVVRTFLTEMFIFIVEQGQEHKLFSLNGIERNYWHEKLQDAA